jgi:hypothetical protein
MEESFMNIVEKLLKLDVDKLEINSKEVKVDKLSEALKEDAKFTCNQISVDRYNEIQANAIKFSKKGNVEGIDTGSMQVGMVLAGVPELKSKALLDHFKAATPEEFLKNPKLFTPGDIATLANAVSELSGISEIEKADEEIKNF